MPEVDEESQNNIRVRKFAKRDFKQLEVGRNVNIEIENKLVVGEGAHLGSRIHNASGVASF